MGYSAIDSNLGRVMASKGIQRIISDPEVLGDIRREAKLTASLDQPNIVTIFDSEVDDAMA